MATSVTGSVFQTLAKKDMKMAWREARPSGLFCYEVNAYG